MLKRSTRLPITFGGRFRQKLGMKQIRLDQKLQIIDLLKSNLLESTSSTEADIKKYFQELIDSIKSRENELLLQNKQLYQQKLDQYQNQQEKYQIIKQFIAEIKEFQVQSEKPQRICQMFLKLKAMLFQLENDAFQLEWKSHTKFQGDQLIEKMIQANQFLYQFEDYNQLIQKLRISLDCQPKPIYSLQKERQCDDDSQQAQVFISSIKPEQIGNYLVDCPDGTLDHRAATLSLKIDQLQNIPHECFNGVRLYFEQIQEFFGKLEKDLQQKIQNFDFISQQLKNISFKSDLATAVPVNDYSDGIFKQMSQEFGVLKEFFGNIATDFQNQLIPFVQQNEKSYQVQMNTLFNQFQNEILEYDKKQTVISSLQDDVVALLRKYEFEEEKQLEFVRQNSELKRQQSINVKRAEQNYNQKLTQFQVQLNVFLTFELNTRRKVVQILNNLQQLENNRFQFIQMFVQNQHRIVYKQIQKLIQNQVQTDFQIAQIQNSEIVYQILYSIFKLEPQITQIAPQVFTNFQQNLQQQFQSKLSLLNQTTSEQLKAPYGAVGKATAIYDFEPEEENFEQSLPLKENAEYWIFEFDESGWSVVASVNYPGVKAVAPSNYLKLVYCVNDYKWSGGVLKQCGGNIENVDQQTKKVENVKTEALKALKATFEFQPENSDEISLQEGDKITISEVDGDWIKGINQRSGKVGFFPGSYVE